MNQALQDLLDHEAEADRRAGELLAGSDTFNRLALSLSREIMRAQEDLATLKLSGAAPEILGRLPMLEQRHIALQRVVGELQQEAMRVHDLVTELRHVAGEFRTAAMAPPPPPADVETPVPVEAGPLA